MLEVLLLSTVLAQPPIATRTVPLADAAPLAYREASTGLQLPGMESGDTEVEMADVDGDGNVDLVSVGDHGSPFVNTQEHGVMVWFGDGRGVWSLFQVGNFGYGGVAIGDVDNDGRMDVGYGVHHDYSSDDFGDQLLEVALGDGTGRAWTPWDDDLAGNGETWGMHGTDFGDVDNDGDLDVASVSFGCGAGVHVYLNDGDGSWTQSFGFLGGNAESQFLQLDDVDGDGNLDLITGHQNGTVFRGDGTGGFVRADTGLPTSTLGLGGFDTGDLDGDGRQELFLPRNGAVQVWELTPAWTWQRRPVRELPLAGVTIVAATDADADGVLDVVSFGGGSGIVHLGDRRGGFQPAARFNSPTPSNAVSLRADRDVDHNGRPDIVSLAAEGSARRNRPRAFLEASAPLHLGARLQEPGPGRVLAAGAVRQVRWLSAVPSGNAARVDLELSTTGPTGPWTTVASGLPDNGAHQWRPPATPSASCWLRLTLRDGTARATALRGPFSIR